MDPDIRRVRLSRVDPSRMKWSVSNVGGFITFEGLDGAGKTTQIERLRRRLEAAGHTVLCTREPGGTAVGDQIREILLSPQSQLAPATEVLLYAASRAEHVRAVIRPALERGAIVLCDRFVDASLAYQGAGLSVGVDAVQAVNAFATGNLQPHLTFLFDLPVTASQARVLNSRGGLRPDRIEQRSAAYFDAVRQQFLRIATQHRDRVHLLDATRGEPEIEQEIWEAIAKWWKQRSAQ